MIQVAMIETDKAERLMKALCNNFARKITARYEGDKKAISNLGMENVSLPQLPAR